MEEAQKVLDELKEVRLEKLTGEAKRLFEAIMKIADERDELLEKNKEYEKQLDLDYVEENYIHKDKIKKEIEELGNMKVSGDVFITSVNFAIKILQELLKDGGEYDK